VLRRVLPACVWRSEVRGSGRSALDVRHVLRAPHFAESVTESGTFGVLTPPDAPGSDIFGSEVVRRADRSPSTFGNRQELSFSKSTRAECSAKTTGRRRLFRRTARHGVLKGFGPHALRHTQRASRSRPRARCRRGSAASCSVLPRPNVTLSVTLTFPRTISISGRLYLTLRLRFSRTKNADRSGTLGLRDCAVSSTCPFARGPAGSHAATEGL